MNEYQFSEFIWNKSHLLTPDGKTYNLSDILIESDTAVRFERRSSYVVKAAFTGGILFCVIVSGNDRDMFKSFQNTLHASKLDAHLQLSNTTFAYMGYGRERKNPLTTQHLRWAYVTSSEGTLLRECRRFNQKNGESFVIHIEPAGSPSCAICSGMGWDRLDDIEVVCTCVLERCINDNVR